MFTRSTIAGLLMVAACAAQEPKPAELTADEKKQLEKSMALNVESNALFRAGRYPESIAKLRQALEIRKAIYAAPKFPAGHPDLAKILSNLGIVLHRAGLLDEALGHQEQALAMYQKSYPASAFPDGHVSTAGCLDGIANLLDAMGRHEQALLRYREALAMKRNLYSVQKYPDGHASLAVTLNNLGMHHLNHGSLEKAVEPLQQALEMRRRLFPESSFPDGHPEVAQSLNNVASLMFSMGALDKALELKRESLAMRRRLYPPSRFPDGHPEVATAINNLGTIQKSAGLFDAALSSFEQALEMRKKLYPPNLYPNGHDHLITSIGNMGAMLVEMGMLENALPFLEQALELDQKRFPALKYPNGHPDVAERLNNLGFVLEKLGRYEESLRCYEQSLALMERLYPPTKYPDGNSKLAITLNNLALLLALMGASEKALPHAERSLAMHRKLYPPSRFPNGHEHLANGLNTVGTILQRLNRKSDAKDLQTEALAMNRKLYPKTRFPKGHPNLAASLQNLAKVLGRLGSFDQALSLVDEAAAMFQELFPESKHPLGHPDVARALSDLGDACSYLGHNDRALASYNRALSIRRKIYPKSHLPEGHPEIALTLNNMASLLSSMDKANEAAAHSTEAMIMMRKLTQKTMMMLSETDALHYAHSQTDIKDGFLSFTATGGESNLEVYREIWATKSNVSRALGLRRSSLGKQTGALSARVDELRGLRRRIDQLLQDRRLNADERDRQLAKATKDRDALERELLGAIPLLRESLHGNAPGPDELKIPDRTVFVDLVRYVRIRHFKDRPVHSSFTLHDHYVAFVLTPETTTGGSKGKIVVRRVELGEAAPIDSAITTWRTAIDSLSDVRGVGAGNIAPKEKDPEKVREALRQLVWDPIAKHLPPGTKTIYLSPDGDLARLPWAALPIGKDRVLLEDYEVAVVPHGPFLLEHLKSPRKFDGKDSALVLGGVEYKSKVWKDLPGTLSEMNVISAMAPAQYETASKGEASVERVGKGLANARYAHLATHGYFDADGFAAEKNREDLAMKNRQFGEETRRVASKNPLGFVGLVLVNGEVMSGLSILDLPLENLKLVTLSACETGLGEYTGGKGVENLQMAFHVAGVQNVIASLWKVNDAATPALMAKFYHELWVNKKPPIEAMREAQLFIYFNPDRISDILGERGAPKRSEALAVKNPAKPQAGKRADTRLWAAFVLSGVGK